MSYDWCPICHLEQSVSDMTEHTLLCKIGVPI